MRLIFKIVSITLFFILALSSSAFAADETITITTYYPSPSGSYNELRTNKLAVSASRAMPMASSQVSLVWGEGVSALQTDQGGSIELGGLEDGNITTPYIDFHRDNMGDDPGDYNVRLILMGEDRLDVTGGDVYASGNVFIRTDLDSDGCIMMSYGGNSWATVCPEGYTLNSNSPAARSQGGIFYCCK
ncbi:MAG: hypothetical protein Q8O22_05565 [Candidatus Omnitrophota bacterium]|nr:hypothetical protein [Candidatus Omnitrophota bacterium]